MAKGPRYICTSCGTLSPKWSGRCEGCSAWNTLEQELNTPAAGPKAISAAQRRGREVALNSLDGAEKEVTRHKSQLDEFDRVLGGGLVPASALLLGGDPGIGKSTLLLQAAARFAQQGASTIYISGEESLSQVRMRARRLGLSDAPVQLACATNVTDILATIEAQKPHLVIIDSIQTMWSEHIGSAPGTVTQVRSCAHELTTFAKNHNVSVILVGHVTKDGQIAGPRVVEHLVDTVLYFEGDRGHDFRILRAVKNRFGASGEIGVFEMSAEGLREVANPSALFLSNRDAKVPGVAVFCGIEGTRPVLVEVQALVAPTPHAQAKRSVIGWDSARLSMILAVLESRCGVIFSGLDVYLNIAGGLKISEPAADLAVAAALLSAKNGVAVDAQTVFFGEISLSGALRQVSQTENRLKEAQKLGFYAGVGPKGGKISGLESFTLQRYGQILEVVDAVLPHREQGASPPSKTGTNR